MNRKKLISAFMALGLYFSVTQVQAESEPDKSPLNSTMSIITLSEKSENKVTWTSVGKNQMGVKVVWSKSDSPVYPPRKTDRAQYVSDTSTNHVWLKAFDGPGKYNVRVCEYLDGVCGTYSNQISLLLDGEEKKHISSKFSDISDKSEVYDAVLHLKEKKVVQGYEDGSFKPDKKINRAEFLKIVMEVSGHTPSGGNCFKDVTNQWHAPYICKAKDLDQVKGYNDGNFHPDEPILYAEAAKIIVNLLALETKDSNNENWYHKYVSAMELLSAIPSSIESFEKPITRGEMAEMIYRIDARKTDKLSRTYRDLSGLSSSNMKISLSDAGEGKVIWSTEDGEAKNGFKVVWSKTAEPKYPARDSDRAEYLSDSTSNFTHLKAFDGSGLYHVRVCEYLDGKCGVYSNEIKIELVDKDAVKAKEVKSLKLFEKAEGKVAWEVDGYAPKGFKVVWGKTSNPKYPSRATDKGQYVGDPDTHYAFLKAFDGSGRYYVRVCEYLEGVCGVYSNEIIIDLIK